jgi:tetratricopeptide (TPR) repeat protein
MSSLRAPRLLSLGLLGLLGPASAGWAAPQAAPEGAAEAARAAPKESPPATSPEFRRLSEQAKEAHAAERLDEAAELYEKALELEPGWTEGRFALGTVLYGLDEYREARAAFRRVVAEHPESGTALAFQGICEFQLDNYERALADLQQARAIGLGDNSEVQAVANYHTAILLTRFGHYEHAYEILKEFAMREQDSPSIIEAFGLSVMRLPYLPFEAPVDKREQILMAGRAGYLMARGRRSPSTGRAFEILVQRFPEDPNARYAWAAYLLLDDPDRAIEEFRRVLRIDPNHVPAMLQMALHFIKEGRYEDAVPLAQEAVTIDPDDFAARNALGRALLETGEIERAIEELETGVRLAPESPQMYFHLARAYQRAGQTEKANEARVQFMKLDREHRAERAGAPANGEE